jgi:hypothetical protein
MNMVTDMKSPKPSVLWIALCIISLFIAVPSPSPANEVVDKVKAEREKARQFLVELGATKDEALKVIPKDEECAACHVEHFTEWSQDAPHYQGISFARVAYNHYVRDMKANGLKTDRKVMSACDRCHAPNLQRYGSDKLYTAITDILSEDKEDARVRANEKINSLRAIGVGCIECHISQWTGKLEGPVHGAKGAKAAHPTKMTAEITKSEFCARCHAQDPKDTDGMKGAKIGKSNLIYCALNYDDWKMSGSKQQCQECHMEAVGSRHSHKFPGANSADFLRKAVDVTVSGGPLMSENAYLNIDVNSKAGHIIPEGCILAADVVLKLTVKDALGAVVYETERTWYSQAQGFIPLVFDPEMKKVPRTPAVWAIDDYFRGTALQPGKNQVQVNFRVPAGTKKLQVTADVGYRQKGKTAEMASITKDITL